MENSHDIYGVEWHDSKGSYMEYYESQEEAEQRKKELIESNNRSASVYIKGGDNIWVELI